MTRTSKNLLAFIIGLIFGLIALSALAWATVGFVNWNAASWFNYWGKGKVVRVVEQSIEQQAMALMSSDGGLSYDSEEVTYAVTKYKAPQVRIFSFVNTPVSECSINVFTQHDAASVHGTTMKVDICSTAGTVLKSYTHTYSAAAPNYANGGCNHGNFVLSYSAIRELTSDDIVKVRAYNVGNNSNCLDSDVTTSTVYLVSINATCSGTKYTIPRASVGNYTSSYAVIAYNSGISDQSLREVSDITVEGSGALAKSDFPVPTLVSNSPAITTTDSAYTVDLTKLSFATELNEVNTVYVCPTALSSDITYNGTKIDLILYNIPLFRFAISQLDTPQNLTCVNGKLTWDAVEGAQGYGIFEGENSWIVETPEFDLTDKEFAAGEYTIRIRALGNVGQALATANYGIEVSAYNAAINITQLVSLTYSVEGDAITKFVPHGSKMSEYTYDVTVPGKEFGGWYYDVGFSRPVFPTDELRNDTVIYARLSEKEVVEITPSWWEQHKWQVLIPCIVVGGLIVLAIGVKVVRNRRV